MGHPASVEMLSSADMEGDIMRLPTDEELLLSLRNFEDNFVERKTSSDSRDWLKTAVAFANSTPTGYPAVLFIGVRDDGTPDGHAANLDTLQRTLAEKLSVARPPIYWFCRVLAVDAQQVLAVIIPGSESRPHFAGPAYVRVGAQTVDGSEEKLAELIAQRNSKAYEILKWRGQSIMVLYRRPDGVSSLYERRLIDCNQFFVTLEDQRDTQEAHTLERVAVSWHPSAKRLELDIAV
jgi:hypothetical protein